MPYFNANPGPSIAAAIASRYGRNRNAREAAAAKNSQQKYKFTYQQPRDDFVFFYPRAPSFETQIEREEKRATQAAVNEVLAASRAAAPGPVTTAPPVPTAPPAGTNNTPSAARAENNNTKVAAERDEGGVMISPQQIERDNNNDTNFFVEAHAVAPFAVDSVARSRQDQHRNNQQNNTARRPTEYATEYHPHQSIQRVPANRGVELILQRSGYSNLKSKAASRALPPSGNTVMQQQQQQQLDKYYTTHQPQPTPWEPRPRKPQPEVTLQMYPPPPSHQQNPRNGPRVMYYRPRSAGGRISDIAPTIPLRSGRTAAAADLPTAKKRPASAGAAPAQVAVSRNVNNNQNHNSIPSNAPQTSTGARAASPAVRRSQSVASCGSAKYHANCTAPIDHGYVGKAYARRAPNSARRGQTQQRIQPQQQQTQQYVVAPVDELPANQEFIPVTRNNKGGAAHVVACQCQCPCHALVNHDEAVQMNRFAVSSRRQLHGAPNFQTATANTRSGVGACLEWPIDGKGNKLN